MTCLRISTFGWLQYFGRGGTSTTSATNASTTAIATCCQNPD